MSFGIISAVYLAAAILFILSLGGLSGQESAKRAVWYGIAGMGLAVGATVFGPGIGSYAVIAVMLVVGSVIGWYVAKRVEMTQMPQLVAALHSFVGLAAVFIGFNADLELGRVAALDEASRGALTALPACWRIKQGPGSPSSGSRSFSASSSVPDIHRLRRRLREAGGKVDGKARKWQHASSAGAALLSLVLGLLYFNDFGIWTLVLMTALAFFIGYHLIMESAG